MSAPSRLAENLKKLALIKEKSPSTTHVFVRRTGKDGLTIDIPIGHAELTLRNNPTWELMASNTEMDDAIEKLFKEENRGLPANPVPLETFEVPPKPSESRLPENILESTDEGGPGWAVPPESIPDDPLAFQGTPEAPESPKKAKTTRTTKKPAKASPKRSRAKK